MASQDISQSTNTKVLIACLVISVVFVLFRIFARWFKVRKTPLEAEDLSILLALSSFAIMSALYLAAMPTLYNVEAIGAGEMAPYASLETDLVEMLKYFFVVQFFFWLTLWAVKFSLLFMVKKLTIGLPFYVRIWWVVVVFAFLTFVGCVVSQVTSCSSMSAWFTAGACETPRDAVAKAASLWYALAVDLITDLLIMAIPLRLLWNLQISTIEKSSLGLVFTVGIITMVFAIVRVVSLDASTSGGQVSTTWLILWAAIEGMVAIIVGCLPAFAIFVRGRVEVHRSRYANYNNSKSDPSSNVYSSGTKSRARTESVLLNEMEPVVGSRDGESKKNLVVADGAIFVTQGWSQKWHDGDSRDAKMERDRRLGSLSD